ncbi:hypothetical protein quinque_013073 [Culex quinquefasciatus]
MASPTHRCRLCLTVVSDSARTNLRDIFRDNNGDHLGCKVHRIRNEAGLSTACTNCVKTVHLIDEFRNLCQYNSNFERTAFGRVTEFRLARWATRVVMELMKLLEPQQEEDVCGGSGYLLETVFVKGQQGPAEFGFECEDVEEMCSATEKTRVNWEVDPLTLAKSIPVRWNAKQESHWQSYQEDRTWTHWPQKRNWCSLNDMFHRKRWCSEASDV